MQVLYGGFFHSTEYSRPSLVLDLMEEFRPVVVDSLVLRLVNTRAVTERDFQRPEGPGEMVALTQEALKKFLRYFEERVLTTVQHPATGREVSYRRCFEVQARQLTRVLQGEESRYQPFLVR